MITKKQFLEGTLASYRKEYAVKTNEELIPHVFSSTTMGVCLELAGVLKVDEHPTEAGYIEGRGGLFHSIGYTDENGEAQVVILTTREFYRLLPDE